MIGRLTARVLAALVGLVLAPVGWWEAWATAHDDPWETDQ